MIESERKKNIKRKRKEELQKKKMMEMFREWHDGNGHNTFKT
jgi:hypothetical protein